MCHDIPRSRSCQESVHLFIADRKASSLFYVSFLPKHPKLRNPRATVMISSANTESEKAKEKAGNQWVTELTLQHSFPQYTVCPPNHKLFLPHRPRGRKK